MIKNFDLYAAYYDLLYNDKDYYAEANYVSECIKKYSKNAKDILEFGSGTGTHGLILQKMGYNVFGIERSEQMVEKAIKLGYSCKKGDIVNFKLDKIFDVVTSLFHVNSYINGNVSLENVFKNAATHLTSGGLFIFDVWYTPAVYHQKPETRVKKVENEEISILRIAEPTIYFNRNVVDVKYSIHVKDKSINRWTEFIETHPMRHFSIPEIDLLARLTGFEILKTEEFLSKKVPSENTWGVCFVLKKIK